MRLTTPLRKTQMTSTVPPDKNSARNVSICEFKTDSNWCLPQSGRCDQAKKGKSRIEAAKKSKRACSVFGWLLFVVCLLFVVVVVCCGCCCWLLLLLLLLLLVVVVHCCLFLVWFAALYLNGIPSSEAAPVGAVYSQTGANRRHFGEEHCCCVLVVVC